MLSFTGTVKLVGPEVRVSDKFKKRDLVIDDKPNDQYPNPVAFQLNQDRTSLADNIKPGDEVTVHFSLTGREWKNPQGEIKYFNTLVPFKIEKLTRTSVAATPGASPAPGSPF